MWHNTSANTDHNHPECKRPSPVWTLQPGNQILAHTENKFVAAINDFPSHACVGKSGFPGGHICMKAVRISCFEIAKIRVERG